MSHLQRKDNVPLHLLIPTSQTNLNGNGHSRCYSLYQKNRMIFTHETGVLRNHFPVVVKFKVLCVLCVTGTTVLSNLRGDLTDFLNKLSLEENRLLGTRWPVQKKVALFLSKWSLIFLSGFCRDLQDKFLFATKWKKKLFSDGLLCFKNTILDGQRSLRG